MRHIECLLANTYSEEGLSKTAFVTSKGKYVFKVLPFGIANAPWIFQRVMSLAFTNFGPPSGLLVYMDDVIACSATWEAHLRLLEDMFRALQTAGLTLQPSKIHFGPKEVQYLGHVLSADGIRMGEDRIKAIIDLKTPTTIKELRSVLGTVKSRTEIRPKSGTNNKTLGCPYSQVSCRFTNIAKPLGTSTGRCFYQSKRVINLCSSSTFSPIP